MEKARFHFNIFLVGFMGVGKSTIASQLGKMLHMDRLEMDQKIVEQEGMPVSEIFSRYGEQYFRDVESNLLIELQEGKGMVVSCGGGVVLRRENGMHMKKNGHVIWLTAAPETIYERVKDNKDRPILNNNMNVEFIRELMEKRKPFYEAAAEIQVSTDQKSISQICAEIVEKLSILEEQEHSGEC